METTYQEFSFDSLDALNPAAGGYASTDWPMFMMNRPVTDVAQMKILEVQIPFTYYTFTTANNTFFLEESNPSERTVTIPVGNYSTNSLATALGVALTNASTGTDQSTFTVTYSPITATFTFSSSTNFPFAFKFNDYTVSPANLIGFGIGRSATSVSNGTNQVLVAPNVTMLTGPNYLYLNSNTMGQMFSIYLPEGAKYLVNGTRGPQLAKIPVNVQPNGIIYWTDPCPETWFDMENLPNLAAIDFYFTLGNAPQVVQFNGNPFSLKMGMKIIETTSSAIGASTREGNRVVNTIRSS